MSTLTDTRSQAAFTAGRSADSLNHSVCVLASDSHLTSFQALSLFFDDLNTTKSEPPTNDVEVLFFGSRNTPMFGLIASPPALATDPAIHGPEMNIGTWPLTNCASVWFGGRSVPAILSVK